MTAGNIPITGALVGPVSGGLSLPFSDTFARSDGAIAGPWLGGASWTIASNALLNSPTPGSTTIANGEFTADTTGWTAQNGATLTQRDSAVTPGTSSGGADDGCLEVANTGTANAQAAQANTVTAHKWHRVTVRQYSPSANTTAATAILVSSGFAGPAAIDQTNEDAWEVFKFGARSTSTTVTFFMRCSGAVSGDLSYYDQVTNQQLTLADLLCLLSSSINNLSISAGVTLSGKMSAGVALNWNSATAPTSGVVFYGDGDYYYLDKCVNGTWSQVATGALVHSAGESFKIIKSGTAYTMYHGVFGSETQVSTTKTISDAEIINNKYHGIFDTGDSTITPFALTG